MKVKDLQIPITILLLALVLSGTTALLPKQPRYDWIYEFGKKPANFCTKQLREELPVRRSNVYVDAHDYDFSGETITSILLTASGHQNCAGSIWYNDFIDWQNGFVSQFNMEVSDPTCKYRAEKECDLNIFKWCVWSSTEMVEDRCGADGFAFVLQASSSKALGSPGGGISYLGIHNALAIEFDTFFNEPLNDPSNKIERHISIILRKGRAEANEQDAIAWNDKPLNFKSDRFEAFLSNPSIRIEYLNRYIRVFINNILQLAYYDPLDLKTELSLPSNQFYMGLTAATGFLTENHRLRNWKIWLVRPSPRLTEATAPELVITNELFNIDVYLFEECGNRYVPIPDFDELADLEWIPTANCQMVSKTWGTNKEFFQTGPAYRTGFRCSKSGLYTFDFTYKDSAIKNRPQVNIKAGPMTSAKVELTNGNKGSVDNPFIFKILPFDSGRNPAEETTVEEIRRQLNIVWPKTGDSKSGHQITRQADNTFIVSVSADKIGIYKIKSSLFISYVAEGEYSFQILVGDISTETSRAVVYNETETTKNASLAGPRITAGLRARVEIFLFDKNGNPITYSQSPSMDRVTCERVSGGESLALTAEKVYENPIFYFVFENKGTNQLKPKIFGKDVNCALCNFEVTPGRQNWEKTDLFKRYESQYVFNGPNFVLDKTQVFDFLLVLKDDYDNVIDNLVATEYQAILNGNYMDDMKLVVEKVSFGARLTINKDDLSNFYSLVGRKNYFIKITHTPSNNTKRFPLEIKSDGTDSDAGNGPVEPRQTKYWWNKAPASNVWATAGITYQLSIQLCTKYGLRYNGWVPEAKLDMELEVGSKEKEESTDPWGQWYKGPKLGVYVIDVTFTMAQRFLTYNILFDKLPSIRTVRLNTVPNVAYQAWIGESFLKAGVKPEADNLELATGSVSVQYSFEVNIRDQWNNPTDSPNEGFTYIIIKHQKLSDTYRLQPTCSKKDLGLYRCQFVTPQSGTYEIECVFFQRYRKLIAYTVYIQRVEPDLTTTEAMITNDLRNKPVKAGETLSIKITVRDQMGGAWLKSEVEPLISKFGLSLMTPESQNISPLDVKSTNIQENGEILVTLTVQKAGAYKFLPVFNQDKIRCSICDALVGYSYVDFTKTEVKLLKGDIKDAVILNPADTILLDNTKSIPIFIIHFYDRFNNRRPVEGVTSTAQSELFVPRTDKETYKLEYSVFNGDVRFSINPSKEDSYSKELKNTGSSMQFVFERSEGEPVNIKFNSVTLLGGLDDNKFTNDYPTVGGVRPKPDSVEGLAGEFVFFTLELRDDNNLLYNHPTNKPIGWYVDPISSFQLEWKNPIGEKPLNPKISKAKEKGTYMVGLAVERADSNIREITVKFLNPQWREVDDAATSFDDTKLEKFLLAKRTLSIIIRPNKLNYVKLQGDLPRVCVSDTETSFNLDMFDIYGNSVSIISDSSLLGIKFDSSAKDTIVPKITLSSNGVSVSAYCRKTGTVTFQALTIKDSSNVIIPSLTYNVVPGKPSAVKSLADISSTSIEAGATVLWRVKVFDINDNPISFANFDKNSELSLEKFTATTQAPGSTQRVDLGLPDIDDTKLILSFDATLSLSGTHDFAAFYLGEPINTNNFRVSVKPAAVVFQQSSLSKFDSKENKFVSYEDSSNKFVQGIKATPSFKVILKDKFGNVNPAVPSEFKFNLRLTHKLDIQGERALDFCIVEGSLDSFTLCSTVTNKNAVIWDNLRSRDDYDLELRERVSLLSRTFTLAITGDGTNDDPEAGNGLLEVQNTLITPRTPLETRAGDQVQFNIELRTVNANFRFNQWNDNILLRFAQNDGDDKKVVYKVERGDKKGRYIARVTPFKVYSSAEPNLITVLVDNIVVKSYQPPLIVSPGKIDRVIAVDPTTDALVTELPALSVDDVYEVTLKAIDAYDNLVPLSDAKSINLNIQSESGESQIFDRTPLVNGRLRVSFQPKAPGLFSFVLSETSTLKAKILPGKISLETSFATLANEATSVQRAGFSAVFNIYPMDKWGNKLTLEPEVLKGNNIRYFFQIPGLTDGFLVGENPFKLSEDKSFLTFTQVLEKKGTYTFKATLNNQKFNTKVATISISPADIHLPSCQLSYFDSEANRFVLIRAEFPIQENNLKTQPRYSFVLSDKYGNEFDSFADELKSKFILTLSGNKLNQVNFENGVIMGNALLISIHPDSLANYQEGIYEKNPYTLKMEMKTDSPAEVVYKVILLGQGNEDEGATINDPLDISKTHLSKVELKFVAGQYDNLILEFRSSSGKRLADGTGKITFKFSEPDFKAESVKAEVRGRFLISVTGTKSTKSAVMTVLINDIEVPSKVNLNVSPSDLVSIQIATDLTRKGSADEDYTFDVIPYDAYKNLAIVDDDDVNLRVVFPTLVGDESQINRYTPKLQPETGYVRYTVECRRAGEYKIESPLLKDNTKFDVAPGKASKKFSTVALSATQVLAGEKVKITIKAVDQYNNLIDPAIRPTLGGNFDISVKVSDVSTKYELSAGADKTLVTEFIQNKVGQVSVQANVLGELLACDTCLVTVLPAAVDVKRTKFFVLIAGNIFSKEDLVKVSYGARTLEIRAQLADRFDNEITKIYDNETFTASISGHFMKTLSLDVEKVESRTLRMVLPAADGERFSRLVPALNYSITLAYNRRDPNFQENGVLSMDIEGKEDGAGNGELDVRQSKLSRPDLFLVAGEEQFITVELRTEQGLRYNGLFNFPGDIKVAETAKSSGKEKLRLNLYSGDKNGIFVIGFYGEIALPEKDNKVVSITIQNIQVPQEVTINVIPARPDLQKVQINTVSKNLNTDEPMEILLTLFDRFDNRYSGMDLADNIFARAMLGRANFTETTVDAASGSYKIVVTPIYPPRYLEIMIFFEIDQNNTVPILSQSIQSQVKTKFAPLNTDVIGSDLSGVPIGEDFDFSVLLKDNKGYCYEDIKKVSVTVSGPYATSTIGDNTPVQGEQLVTEKDEGEPANPKGAAPKPNLELADLALETTTKPIMSGEYECQRFYNVKFVKNRIKKVGYYQVQVYIEGENSDLPVMTKRLTYMTPGATDPRSSVISVPALANNAPAQLALPVNTTIRFFVNLHDEFRNRIFDNRSTDSVSFAIRELTAPNDYEASVENLYNATFAVSLNVYKTGLLKGMEFTINNEIINFVDLKKSECPEVIRVLPGNCSNKMPRIDNKKYNLSNITVGNRDSFAIQCLDSYGNLVEKGGDKFEVIIHGKNLSVVQFDTVEAIIKDKKNGGYDVEFTVAWAGIYQATVTMNNQPYGDSFNITVGPSVCPLAEAPQFCINNINSDKKCAKDYKACGFPELPADCPEDKPFKCEVGGTPTCVRGQWVCDCPEGEMKCDSDNKCVPINLFSDLCLTIISSQCSSGDYPYLCPDGSCRKSSENCPSQPGCPPSMKLCPDQSCVLKTAKCPAFTGCNEGEKIYKCEDQTCVAKPEDCPSRLVCSNPNYILCPDNSCASSELFCKLPPVCQEGRILCPDNSCRPSLADCPQRVTCPENFALCQDGSCRADCVLRSLSNSTNTPKRTRFARLLAAAASTEEQTCGASSVVCPGGECAANFFMCPSVESCPDGSVRCPDQSCATSIKQCVARLCQPGEFHCWDGKCVKERRLCSTRTSCPDNLPVKCTDGTCVSKNDQCPDVIPCPPHSPYKCSTGDCRAKAAECPTLITCPAAKPVKCSDGSCVIAKYHCGKNVELQKCDSDEILCPDGSCSKSKHLCPTTASCNVNQVRCWDNTCTSSLENCKVFEKDDRLCPSNRPLRCPDGTCRDRLSDCPSQIICPQEAPIKCDDGTCKESITQCAIDTECSFGLKRCPDGSCTQNTCGTPITCPRTAPYKCYDSTCKKDPRDCPEVPKCNPKAPILCPDGTCASQRVNCKGFEICPLDTPIRCPDMNCYRSADQCQAIKGCPVGRVLCEDGSCAVHAGACPSKTCPSHLRFRCPDGFCVSDEKYCDSKDGCPYNKPFKCGHGLCVANVTSCPNNNTFACPKADQVLCPDGSCALDKNECPNSIGCPLDKPLKCASGLCVDPLKTNCSVAACPKEAPIKCLDGICAQSVSSCPSFLTLDDYLQCTDEPNGNIVPCADGRCVASADQCRPLYECKERCPDGSCRVLRNLCPLVKQTCPPHKPHRCEVGACATDEMSCPISSNGCPIGAAVKCEMTGSCAVTNEQCELIYNRTILNNGCPINRPNRCANSTCVKSENECKKEAVCKAGEFLCLDGTCRATAAECRAISKKCSQDEVQCPDGLCSKKYSECNTLNGCPVTKPFKCADGSCKSSPFKGNNSDGCPPNVKCPKYKPFLCADGECQGDPALCRTQKPCPVLKGIRCPDHSCVNSTSECPEVKLCPITSPILCENGDCVESPLECKTSSSFCPEDKPKRCSNGLCVKLPRDCLPEGFSEGKDSRRILQDANLSSFSNYSDSKIDIGCTEQFPHRCYDGSCRAKLSECPIYEGCNDPKLPYRCLSGACVSNQDSCVIEDKPIGVCSRGTRRCEDGICRAQCPAFFGCPNDKPIHCPNGFCAITLADCFGDASCPIDRPYRCVDNLCSENMIDCQRPKRSYQPEIIQLTVSPFSTKIVEFIQMGGSSSVKLGKIILPAGSMLYPLNETTSNETVGFKGFVIKPVAESNMKFTKTKINKTRITLASTTFPLTDGVLNFHQTVRSPIVDLSALERNSSKSYRFPLILELSSDRLLETNKTRDYCLGTVSSSGEWVCHSRDLLKEEFETERFAYPVSQDGIYAVIYNPAPDDSIRVVDTCDWWCENKMTILYVFISLLVVAVIGTYLIWRVTRYITKYREAKKQMDNFREQISELEKAQTEVVGQTLRDKIEGINFTSNPAFKKDSDKEHSEEIQEMEAALERLAKRDKILAEQNKDLMKRNDLLTQEYDNLHKELERLKGEGDVSGNQEFD